VCAVNLHGPTQSNSQESVSPTPFPSKRSIAEKIIKDKLFILGRQHRESVQIFIYKTYVLSQLRKNGKLETCFLYRGNLPEKVYIFLYFENWARGYQKIKVCIPLNGAPQEK
jgi:hypothetical protein